jgi:ribose/xylose/arabinose/galactoside ABC-type transport system permease subunit
MEQLHHLHPATPIRTTLGDPAVGRWLWPLLALALIMLVDGVISPGFFSVRIVEGRLFGSVIDVLYRGAPTALVALGMAVVIGTRGIDLSVGAVIAIVGAVMTDLIHRDMAAPAVLALALGTGVLCGLWNGVLVAILDIQPIIATLILMVAGRGIAQMINTGKIITFRSEFFSAISSGQVLTVPSRIVVAVAAFMALWVFLRRTALGLFIESVGGNAAAANLAGVDARLVKIGAYMLSGLCSAVAGVLICADVRGSDANNAGLFIELDAILAVVIGGASLSGGRFYLGLTVIGVLIIQSLTTSILVSGLPPQYNLVVKAVVILIVLLFQARPVRERIFRLVGRRST